MAGHVNIGRTQAGAAVTGGRSLLLGGSRTKGTITVVYERTPAAALEVSRRDAGRQEAFAYFDRLMGLKNVCPACGTRSEATAICPRCGHYFTQEAADAHAAELQSSIEDLRRAAWTLGYPDVLRERLEAELGGSEELRFAAFAFVKEPKLTLGIIATTSSRILWLRRYESSLAKFLHGDVSVCALDYDLGYQQSKDSWELVAQCRNQSIRLRFPCQDIAQRFATELAQRGSDSHRKTIPNGVTTSGAPDAPTLALTNKYVCARCGRPTAAISVVPNVKTGEFEDVCSSCLNAGL
jgi:ribosomal protein L32